MVDKYNDKTLWTSAMKCLYDIGRAAAESENIEDFLSKAVALIPGALLGPKETAVRITLRNSVFVSPAFREYPVKTAEDLPVAGETQGTVEIYSRREMPYLDRQNYLTRALAERIGGGVRQVELEKSLRGYDERLEKEVEARTKDLERVQEKLIRSERLAAVGELASGVGHELRNPLNVIRNCAYLLNLAFADKGDEEAFNTIKVLNKQIDIANKIITDLLDFTRIEPPAPSRVDLGLMIKECLSWIAIPENMRVRSNLNGNSPQVVTDGEQISRVFANIISNAVQAMGTTAAARPGELFIEISNDENEVRVKFQDNGCGIPAENMGKIFEPLFTTRPKGIGLGLAISKRLVEQNGGKIEVASLLGEGATFTVKLPLNKRR